MNSSALGALAVFDGVSRFGASCFKSAFSSFGTGQHNTTQLCLELVEKNISEGDKILDLGCGSGILSIGALLLGAGSATAVDIDENSVKIAKENAEKNNISPKLAKSLEKVLSDMKLTDKSRVGVFHYTLSDVSDWKQTNDWAEGKRYSGYMAQEHIFYFYEKNDEIVGVRTSNNEVLYQKKEK